MSNKRKQYTPEFKAKVALAALENEDTLSELAARFGVNPTMITAWKRALVDGASEIFDKNRKALLRAELGSVIDILIAVMLQSSIPNIMPRTSKIGAAEASHCIIIGEPGAAKFS